MYLSILLKNCQFLSSLVFYQVVEYVFLTVFQIFVDGVPCRHDGDNCCPFPPRRYLESVVYHGLIGSCQDVFYGCSYDELR